jgi:hypothetical protein
VLIGATVLLLGAAATAGQAAAGTGPANPTISAAKVFFWPHGGAPTGLTPSTPSPSQYNNLIFPPRRGRTSPARLRHLLGYGMAGRFPHRTEQRLQQQDGDELLTNFFANVGGVR